MKGGCPDSITLVARFRESQVSCLDFLTNKKKPNLDRSLTRGFQLSYLCNHIKKLIVKHWHNVTSSWLPNPSEDRV